MVKNHGKILKALLTESFPVTKFKIVGMTKASNPYKIYSIEWLLNELATFEAVDSIRKNYQEKNKEECGFKCNSQSVIN